jgi:hypothetical protein
VTQNQTNSGAGQSVGQVAGAMFGSGFFVGEAVREELRAEASVRLAYALRAAGVHPDSVHALALAVREVGDSAPLENQERAPLTDGQRKMLQGLIAERGLPAAFREILEAAFPKVTLRRDLVALYGVLSGTYERMGRIEAVRAMPVDVPTPKR